MPASWPKAWHRACRESSVVARRSAVYPRDCACESRLKDPGCSSAPPGPAGHGARTTKLRPRVRLDQVACDVGARAAERGGARAGSPRCSRTDASRTAAMIFSSPPQFGQCSMSISNTRLSRHAQPMSDAQRPSRTTATRSCDPVLAARWRPNRGVRLQIKATILEAPVFERVLDSGAPVTPKRRPRARYPSRGAGVEPLYTAPGQ